MRGGITSVYIDFNKINSISELASRVVSETVNCSYSKIEKGLSFVKDNLLSLRPTFTPADDGGFSISLKLVEKDNDLERALDFPQKVAEKKNTEIVIAMDEFQRISTLDGDILERLLRSIIQEQDRVTYIFCGSQVNMLKEMFENEDRPFFKSIKIMKLGLIPTRDFKEYILNGFEKTGVKADKTVVDDILDFTKGHPMRTKELCFELWNRNKIDDPVGSLDQLLGLMIENDIYTKEAWNGLTSAVQRRTLVALANRERPYSHKTIDRYELKGSSHVERAIKSLERDGILYEGEIVDPFLREWVKRISRQF